MTTLEVHHEKQNLEDITVVWLGSERDISKSMDTRMSVRNIINYMTVFTNIDECIDYITSIQTEKVFLIVSDAFCRPVIPFIWNATQIKGIYIYCLDASNTYPNPIDDTYQKFRGSYSDKSCLISKLQEDASSFYSDILPISIIGEKSIQDLNKESVSFMWFWLLLEILVRMPDTEIAKREMINECRMQYEYNGTEQDRIDTFENSYDPDKAIWWYTRDSFVYRLLNKALRTEDLDIIFKFRFIITDLYNQLHKLQAQMIQSASDTFTVYRGQTLSTDELSTLKANINGLISMNTFLSTTMDKTVALIYAGDGSQRPHFESVLFEICMNTFSIDTSKPFANIQNLSYFKDENEVLLSMGTIFRINSVEQLVNDDRIYNVKLTLSEETDEQIKSMTEHLRKEMGETTSLLTLGNFLRNMGKHDKAAAYYEILLEQLPSDHAEIPKVFNGIGKVKEDLGEYDMAIEVYEKARDMLISNPTDSLLASTYYKIGDCYRRGGHIEKALENYDKAEHADLFWLRVANENEAWLIKETVRSGTTLEMPGIYDSLGSELDKALSASNLQEIQEKLSAQKQVSQAVSLTSDMKLKIEECNRAYKALGNDALVRKYRNDAETSTTRGDYSMALKQYAKALEIESNPSCMANIYDDIALVYQEKKDFTESIRFYRQSLKIRLDTFPTNYVSIAYKYAMIGSHYRQMNDIVASLENYMKALELKLKFLPLNHVSIAHSYADIGYAYEHADNYASALENYEKALNSLLETSPTDKQFIIDLYGTLAEIYIKMNNYDRALHSCEKALEIDGNIQHLPGIHRKLAHIYKLKGDHAASVISYNKELELTLTLVPLNEKNIAEIYADIGHAYEHADNYASALENYDKALNSLLETSPTPNQLILDLRDRMAHVRAKLKLGIR